MLTLFSFIFFISLLCFIIGLVRPQLFKLASRKPVIYIWGTSIILSLVAVSHLTPSQSSQKPVTVQGPATPVVSVQPATTTQHVATRSECTVATKSAFGKMVDLYTALYGDGRSTLGTVQYKNSSLALKDMSVAGTPESNFAGWQKTYHAMNPTPFDKMMSIYRTASDCYFAAGVEEPASLTALRDDMSELDTAIGIWSNTAIDWQDSVNSDAKLKSDEDKVNTLFVTLKKDVTNLK